MAPRTYRLAAVTSHPVQYQAPLFRRIAAHGSIDLTVFYGHDGSVAGDLDRDFGLPVRWDRPLLDGYQCVFLQRRVNRLNGLRRLAADARIIAHLWRQRFDAVFIHSYATRLSFFAYIGALASRTPVLLRTESETLQSRALWVKTLKHVMLRPLFAMTSGVLVIGEANGRFFDHYGVKRGRQFFTPYAVDNAYFLQERQIVQPLRQQLRHGHGWTDDIVVVGFSGKLIPRKGVDDLLDAVAALQDEGLRVGLFLIGEGRDRALLEERARARRLKWIVFSGFKNQSELAACYVCLDVLVLPSRFDPWGLVLNEAMLFGVPVVATKMVGASMDLIEHGKNGYVFDAGDVNALTEMLRSLVTSSTTRRQFGQRSEVIVERYSYDVCVRGILDALRYVGERGTRRIHAAAHGKADK